MGSSGADAAQPLAAGATAPTGRGLTSNVRQQKNARQATRLRKEHPEVPGASDGLAASSSRITSVFRNQLNTHQRQSCNVYIPDGTAPRGGKTTNGEGL